MTLVLALRGPDGKWNSFTKKELIESEEKNRKAMREEEDGEGDEDEEEEEEDGEEQME